MFAALSIDERWHRAFEVYRRALSSPFYSAKYEGSAAPHDEVSWRELPILSKQDLYDYAYPRSTAMLTQPLEGMIVSSTGGSTGVARYTLLTHQEWETFAGAQARAIQLLGVGPSDRVANLFIAGHLWPSFLGVHEAVKIMGAVHLPISANIPPEEIVRLCQEFDPSVMLSLPTLFVFLADIATRDNLAFPSLRLIGYAGEQMSEQAQQYVRSALKVDDIKALAYSSADAGLMGYQCGHCGFATYHLPTDFQFIEILEPESRRPAAPGENGDLIVTNLARLSMPIIRYAIGDVGAFLPERCDCGDANPLFRLAGRAGDDFKLGGAYISMRVFDEALSAVGHAVSLNYAVELEDIGNQMDVRLRVEAADPERARELEGQLRAAVEQRVPEIGVGQQMQYIRQFDIDFVALGTLPSSPITGKVQRLYDKRVVEADAAAGSGAASEASRGA